MLVITAVVALGGLTLLLATGLIVANRKLHVEEDPRFDVVEDMLPSTNCGACGFPGCRPFAEALVSGEALPGKCTVSGEADRVAIAAYLGVDVGAEEKRVARLACAGGTNVARNHARYDGLSVLSRRRARRGWWQRLLLGLPGARRLRAHLRLRCNHDEPVQAAGRR